MPQIHLKSAAEQVATQLRQEMVAGLRSGVLPGVNRLALELGVNHKTVGAALLLLEKEGVLINQGARRSRLIAVSREEIPHAALRIAIFQMESRDGGEDFMIELRHLFEEAGHLPFYPEKTMLDLGMDAGRIARYVKRTEADAWVILAGSREILHWFSEQATPAFALFGRRDELSIAAVGPDKSPPHAAATRHLIGLGHRRITFLIRKQHRLPAPAPSVRAFLDELEAHDIQAGEFNLPDWEETRAGFQEILESLFRLTPPTAIFTDEAFLFIAAQQFMARRGIRVPDDVSLICTDSDRSFDWCNPSVAHIRWDYRPVVRRIVRWADNVSRGQDDRRQTLTKAEFVDGGTVGPVA